LSVDPTVAPLVLQAAAAATGQQSLPAGTLYAVATPIGNLADLTLRAVHVLARADAIACEDTRVAAGLLRHLGLHKPLLALHTHNEATAAGTVLQRLAAGERVALISDAGTPAVSDPGARVVAAAVAAGHRVVPVPGPSSALAVLSVAGDAVGADTGSGFVFVGFLPARGGERQAAVQAVAADGRSQIVFEAPHRIGALLAELAAAAPARTVTLGRELTKQFETVHTALAETLPGWLAADARLRRPLLPVRAPRAGAWRKASSSPAASPSSRAWACARSPARRPPSPIPTRSASRRSPTRRAPRAPSRARAGWRGKRRIARRAAAAACCTGRSIRSPRWGARDKVALLERLEKPGARARPARHPGDGEPGLRVRGGAGGARRRRARRRRAPAGAPVGQVIAEQAAGASRAAPAAAGASTTLFHRRGARGLRAARGRPGADVNLDARPAPAGT
jgi:16S rRNA (cytidine1402-2'-O)-methyltransferase